MVRVARKVGLLHTSMKPLFKILIIIGAVVVLGAAAYFIWWLFVDDVKPGALPDSVPGGSASVLTSTSTNATGEASALSPRTISDRAIFDYWTVPETGEIYYLTPEGMVFVVKEGSDLEISRQSMTALNHAEPSFDGRRLLVSFGNPSSPQWAIFDTVDSIWRPLPREITNAGWGRTLSELVVGMTSGSDYNLSFADISKSPFVYTVIVRDFRLADVRFSTLLNGTILIAEHPSSLFDGGVWSLNPTTRALSLVLSPEKGRTVKVEPQENASYLGTTKEFSVANGTFQNTLPLFFLTLPDKCSSAASTTYCFVPKNLTSRITLPDDYYTHAFYSLDALYSINQKDGAIASIPLSDFPVDASRVHADNRTVYFINRYDSLLYKLEIQ